MSVSIIACPSCKTMLLSDTVQCPHCRHVLDGGGEREMPGDRYTGQPPSRAPEDPCPRCGEMVRKGLVRCWSCGTFMRADIAAAYRKMQTMPQPIIYSDLPTRVADDDDSSVPSAAAERAGVDDDLYADDQDFELSANVTRHASSGAAQSAVDQPAATVPADAGPANDPASSRDSGADGASAETEKQTSPAEPEQGSQAAHSVATGGEALLRIALEEEAGRTTRGKQRPRREKGGPGLRVYCPNGHRIEVQEKHRGLAGRCPRCKALFFVPERAPDETQPTEQAAPAEGRPAQADKPDEVTAGKYARWMTDVRLHTVNPQQLRLKPGSLKAAFQEVDLGFAEDGLLAVTLLKKGLFGPAGKKEPTREQMLAHLREEKPLEELPVASHQAFDGEKVKAEVRVVQPVRYAHESMFAGIPVFGEGWIAVRLPQREGTTDQQFLSFPLSHFRRFAEITAEMYGFENLCRNSDVPLSDTFAEQKCHYSEETLRILEHAEFYRADPSFKVTLIGRRCEGCGLVVSEDSRKKEKIGGPSGRTIAKAICPKCKKRFGDIPLYTLDEPPGEKPPEEPESSESAEAASTEPAAAPSQT